MGSKPAQPPRRVSARLRAALNTSSSRISPPLDLPFDIVYAIFEFHLINAGDFHKGFKNRELSRVYKTGVSYFAGVCRSWRAASSSAQRGYSINSLPRAIGFGVPPPSADDIYTLGRLEALKQLLDSPFSPGESGVDSLLVNDDNWSRAEDTVLRDIIARSTATLTTARLNLFFRGTHVPTYFGNADVDPGCGLLEALLRAENLEDLELGLEPDHITPGEYIQFIQTAKSLRELALELGPGRQYLHFWSGPHGLSTAEALRQLSELHLAPDWHHITSLTIYCNYTSLPILEILLPSGTITDLTIQHDDDAVGLPEGISLRDFWVRMGQHVSQIEYFTFQQHSHMGEDRIDDWLPHFTSCATLQICQDAVISLQPLLSLPRLTALEVSYTWPLGVLDTFFGGLTVHDLEAFLDLKGDQVKELHLTTANPGDHPLSHEEFTALEVLQEKCDKRGVKFYISSGI